MDVNERVMENLKTFGLDTSVKLNITSISSAVSMTSKASRYLRGGHI